MVFSRSCALPLLSRGIQLLLFPFAIFIYFIINIGVSLYKENFLIKFANELKLQKDLEFDKMPFNKDFFFLKPSTQVQKSQLQQSKRKANL